VVAGSTEMSAGEDAATAINKIRADHNAISPICPAPVGKMRVENPDFQDTDAEIQSLLSRVGLLIFWSDRSDEDKHTLIRKLTTLGQDTGFDVILPGTRKFCGRCHEEICTDELRHNRFLEASAEIVSKLGERLLVHADCMIEGDSLA